MDVAKYLRGKCAVAALALTMATGVVAATAPSVGASVRGAQMQTSVVSGADNDSDLQVSVPSLAATVGTPISQTVATFADPPDTDRSSAYIASIDWGDGTAATSGSISQPGGSGTDYAVDGSHTYAASGTFTVTVTVTEPRSSDSETGTGTGTASVAGQVITCTGSCSGSVTSGPETLALKAQSGTGSITIALNDGSLTCAGTFRHAPKIATEIPSGVNPNRPIHVKVTFPQSDLVGTTGPVEVCYQSTSNHTFVDINGQTVTPGNSGLLPLCSALPGKPRLGPCLVRAISTGRVTITERLLIPPDDPRHS
jgi:hypothetical protein